MPTILIVDDDDLVAQTIDRTLRRNGFQTVVAHSGVEALKMARRHPPDLVVLDVIMPGLDGFEVCREIRWDKRLAHLPILFLTARAKDSDVIEGFTSGADDYMTKPFNIDELTLRVEAILRRTQTSATRPAAVPAELKVGDARLEVRACQLVLPHGSFTLTPVQFDLVYHLMVHAGEVFSTHRLLQDVWDYPHDTGSPDLVRVHIKNLRQRIEPDPSSPIYLQTVAGHGYTFAVHPPD